jgi:AcrR family transcriptional regulator
MSAVETRTGIPRRRRYVEKPDVRKKLLDAAEELIRDDGYAAASVRAIAERVGMRHQAIFYYFGSQEELLLEVYRRATRQHRERLDAVLGSDNPIRGIWDIARDTAATALSIEFMALANHNDLIRAEIAKDASEFRAREVAAIVAYLNKRGISPRLSPEIVSILTNASARLLVQEANIGITIGHDAFEALVEESFRNFEAGGSSDAGIGPMVDTLAELGNREP